MFDQFNKECRFPRNAVYEKNVTINNASIITTQRLTLPDKCEQRQKILQLTITSKDYYQKIMQHNTYIKVEMWALHLI